MSYWGAQVIVNLFGPIPLIGPDLALWIRGDYVVSDATLNRFFALHVIAIPMVLTGMVTAHLIALHEVGSNNPDGIEVKESLDAEGNPVDAIPSHPYYTWHDPVKSIRYRPHWHKYVYAAFFLSFLSLGYLGTQPPTAAFATASQACTILYFSFFLLMPWWSEMGTFKMVPKRVTFHPH